jgi:SAM-dependent methyltransferase
MSLRDTDADWRAITSAEPYYGVLADRRFLKRNLTEDAIEEFYRLGDDEIEWVVSNIKTRFDPAFRPAHVIDFGCGVGRHSFALATHAGRVTGVDTSPAMLEIAEQHRKRRRLATIGFRGTLPDEPVQWVHSYLVFQHIPPARGYGLLRDLLSRLAPGGMASIQVMAYREPRHLGLDDIGLCSFDGEKLAVLAPPDEMPVGVMQMYDYDLGKLLPVFVAAGIGALWLFHVDFAGHHGVWLLGRRE